MKIFFCLFIMLIIPLMCFPDTITLKSGKTVEGKIIETANDYIKIDVGSIVLTYWKDDLQDTSILVSNNSQPSPDVNAEVPSEKVSMLEGLTIKDVGEFITYYYENPEAGRLITIFKFLLTQEKIINDPDHFGTMIHFFATAAHNDKKILDSFDGLLNQYSGIQKDVLNRTMAEARNFKSPEPDSPMNLDNLWAEFMATGRPEPVKKIMSVLGYPQKGLNIALIAAAQWSLTSNVAQHKRVFEIIQRESFQATGEMKEKIEKILVDAQKQPRSPRPSE